MTFSLTSSLLNLSNILLKRNWNYTRVTMADEFDEQAESDLTYLVDQKNGDWMIK